MKLFKQVRAINPPYVDRLAEKAEQHFFRDALAVKRTHTSLTPSQIQWAIFSYMPVWVDCLMAVRNRMVKLFGFDVGTTHMMPASNELEIGERAGFLTVAEKYPNEIISYAEDKHMTFYLSVAINHGDIVVSTLVNQKTLMGRIYVNAILPFHYFIARIVINNAIKAGRI